MKLQQDLMYLDAWLRPTKYISNGQLFCPICRLSLKWNILFKCDNDSCDKVIAQSVHHIHKNNHAYYAFIGLSATWTAMNNHVWFQLKLELKAVLHITASSCMFVSPLHNWSCIITNFMWNHYISLWFYWWEFLIPAYTHFRLDSPECCQFEHSYPNCLQHRCSWN